jgi:hypothetical protein
LPISWKIPCHCSTIVILFSDQGYFLTFWWSRLDSPMNIKQSARCLDICEWNFAYFSKNALTRSKNETHCFSNIRDRMHNCHITRGKKIFIAFGAIMDFQYSAPTSWLSR